MRLTFNLPKEPIIIVDTEGNGASPQELIELAIVTYPAIDKVHQWNWLIKPEIPINWRVRKIHGISNEAVANCPSWLEIQEEVRQNLEGKWFVAHNAATDYNIIKRYLPDWEPLGVLDTLVLARNLCPEAPNYKLETLLNYTGLRSEASGVLHRAGDDAYATTLLLEHLFHKSNANSWQEICEIAKHKKEGKTKESPPEQGSLF
jgi:DNA polymerase III epsilon subunit-like protein